MNVFVNNEGAIGIKMAKLNKRLAQAYQLVDKNKFYQLDEALNILCQTSKIKFDETVDLAVRLGLDPRKAEENIRGTVALPHGTGKKVRVLAFCKIEKQNEAKAAGADYVGAEDLIEKIQNGWFEFESVIATPDMMAQVGKIGKILGPRGLMPNPKVGTVTQDIGKTIEAIKSGRIEYRIEKAGIVHVGAGKISFGQQKLKENLVTLIETLVKAKPKTSKGIYLKTISLSSTMGPGLKIDVAPFRNA